MTPPARQRLIGGWFRLLLRLLPGHVRDEHERELAQFFAMADPGGSRARFWFAVLRDVATAAPRAHADVIRQDLRFAFRQLRRSPGVSIAAVATLAIGIGGTATLFALIDRILLAPLPYRGADRLVELTEQNPGQGWRRFGIAPGNFRSLADRSPVLEVAAAYYPWSGTVKVGDTPDRLTLARVDGRFFQTMAEKATLGRTLGADDDVPGANVVVISDRLWRGAFGMSGGVVGATLEIDGVIHRIVGVMPPGFEFPSETAAWKPLAQSPSDWTNRGARYLTGVARLAPGVSVERARTALGLEADRLAAAFPETNRGWTADVVGLREAEVGSVRGPLLLAGAAAFLVLLIAVANVANLLLSRALTREREMSLRAALGARTGRLLRQLFTEGLVLAVLAGGIGLALASVLLHALAAGSVSLRLGSDLSLGSHAVGFTTLLVLLAAVLSSLLPAAVTRRLRLSEALRDGRGSGTRARRRWQAGLVVGEVALASFVLVGSALVIRTLTGLLGHPLGFEPKGVLTFRVEPPWRVDLDQDGALARLAVDRTRAVRGFRRLADRLAERRTVESVGAINRLPLTGNWWNTTVDLADHPAPTADRRPNVQIRVVMPGYFETIGTRVLRGRGIVPTDEAETEVVTVIDEAFARSEWGHRDPLGSVVLLYGRGGEARRARVVGVVESVPMSRLDAPIRPVIYVPLPQGLEGHYLNWGMDVVIRAAADTGLRSEIRAAVREVFPDAAVFRVATMGELVDQSLAGRRLQLLLLGVFGVVALGLSMVGVAAVLMLMVRERRTELGVRLALGARPAQLWWRVQTEGLGFVAAGTAIGDMVALSAAGAFASLVYGISVRDPIAFVSGPALLGLSGSLAAAVPALRAMRTDPVLMLRDD